MKDLLVGQVKAVDSEDPNGEFEVVLSAPTLDRDGEVIDAKAFEPLPPHITFDIDHGMSVATTVGSGVPTYDGDLLKVRGTYSSIGRAQEVRTLVKEGHIRTTSVAFMGAKREVKDGVPHVVKAELLNGAFVPIPSNREAAVLVAKAASRVEKVRKAIAGSFEERRDLLNDAVRAAHADAYWSYVVATFDDAVVYEVEGPEGTEQFRAPYTLDGDTVTLGTAEPVDITEVIQPKSSTETDDEKAAAPAPAVSLGSSVVMAEALAAAALLP